MFESTCHRIRHLDYCSWHRQVCYLESTGANCSWHRQVCCLESTGRTSEPTAKHSFKPWSHHSWHSRSAQQNLVWQVCQQLHKQCLPAHETLWYGYNIVQYLGAHWHQQWFSKESPTQNVWLFDLSICQSTCQWKSTGKALIELSRVAASDSSIKYPSPLNPAIQLW